MSDHNDDEDIELERLKLTSADHNDEYERDEDNNDEEALLGGDGGATKSAHSAPAALWPQIKGIVRESAPTLLFTTLGLLLTGELLDHVSHWHAMVEVDQLIMIIPVVLNLKGNLEMNLSARLGTSANMGHLDDVGVRNEIIKGNLSLLQVQATVVSFVAACVSLVLGLIVPRSPAQGELVTRRPRPTLPPTPGRESGIAVFTMVASTTMTSACLSSIILGSFMCALIVMCRKYGLDPDNIAPPIAACLGDLVTLILLGLVSTALIAFLHTPVPALLALIVVLSTTACLLATRRNPHVRDLIWKGWSPLFGAMVISSGTGIVLDLFVSRYEGFAMIAVVISGLPGSVGSILASRLSTALHAASTTNSGRKHEPSHRVVMLTLLFVTIPIEIIFLAMLHFLGWLKLPFVFITFAMIFFCCAVSLSLISARSLTNYLWSKDLDPDMYALPLHSALMDLIGQLLLVVCFEIVTLLGTTLKVRLTPHKL